jgi:hypothetical protein
MELKINIDQNTAPETLVSILMQMGIAYSGNRADRADSFADITQKMGNAYGIIFGSDRWAEWCQDGFFDGFRHLENLQQVIEGKIEDFKEREFSAYLRLQEKGAGK